MSDESTDRAPGAQPEETPHEPAEETAAASAQEEADADAPEAAEAADETTGATAVQPPEATTAATVVQPPSEETPTQVLGAGDTAPTRVMPAPLSAIGSPPPPRPTPTLVQGGGGGPRRLWLWVVVAVVAAVAAIAVIYAVFWPSGNDAGTEFVGTWAPVDMSGGGLIISEDGGTFSVAIYDRQVQPVRTVEASLEDDALTFTTSAAEMGVTGVTGTLDARIVYLSDTDELEMTLTDAQGQSVTMNYLRIDQLVAGAASPSAQPSASPSPSPSLSPSPSPSPSLSGSPSPSASPTGTPDQQVTANIGRLQAGIVAWRNANGGLYPAPTEVTATGGVAQYVNPWPINPFTNAPMQQGAIAGDYTYEQLDAGQNYRLTGYLSNGQTYTVP